MTDHIALTLDGATLDRTLGVTAMRWTPEAVVPEPLVPNARRWV